MSEPRRGIPGITPGQHVLLRRLIEESRLPCAEMRLPADVYTSPARFEAERDHVFRRRPVVVGPSALLPQPGTVVSHDEFGVPLLLARDPAGRLRVHLNACRHRGAQLVDSREPIARARITCPYHAWTYQLDGKLASYPKAETFPACLDKGSLGLIELPSTEAGGLIWVQLSPEADGDFSSSRGELADDFESLGFPSTHLFARRTHELAGNWKLIIDAFQELYHVQMLHAKTVAKMFDTGSRSVDDGIGPHRRFATARRGLGDGLDLLTAKDVHRVVTYSYFVFPNTIIVLSPTYANILVCYPQDAARTLIDDYMITPKAPETDEERKHWERSWDLLDGGVYRAEDFHAAELQQRGLASGILKEVLFGGLEIAPAIFHDKLDACLPR